MNAITLTVNGSKTTALVHPRTHLADFLREQLSLTGTHLGCEQGVCGACTILVDNKPTRSCIAFAVACDGADIRTIEAFDEDPVMGDLRQAFSSQHGLQCGFCTPGMLITSRDIVLRLGEIDERRIREELSGNLCRCTGYMGIVAAVKQVSRGRKPTEVASADAAASDSVGAALRRDESGLAPNARGASLEQAGPDGGLEVAGQSQGHVAGGWTELTQHVAVKAHPDTVWTILKDINRVATCLPGAEIGGFDGSAFQGTMTVKFGPIRARFGGQGTVTYDDANRSGEIKGRGRDALTGSQANGTVLFTVRELKAGSAAIDVTLRYRMTGALAQFSRSSLVQNFVGHLASVFAENMARLAGGGSEAVVAPARELSAFSMMVGVAKSWLKRLLDRP